MDRRRGSEGQPNVVKCFFLAFILLGFFLVNRIFVCQALLSLTCSGCGVSRVFFTEFVK